MAKKLLGFFNKQKQFEQDVMENGMQYSSFYGDSLRRLKKNKMAMFCACVLILLALMAIFAPLLAPYDPTYQDYSAVLGGPCKAHPFGTDEFGRDILSRIIYVRSTHQRETLPGRRLQSAPFLPYRRRQM